MSFTISHNTPLYSGETKRIRLYPKDSDGAALTPASLTLVVSNNITSVTYALSPEGEEVQIESDADSYYVDHTYERGRSTLLATATDGDGRVEKAKGIIIADAA